MSAVTEVDDLPREILLRLGLPTYLVHAAAVSKRWLRIASDPAFLRRFRGHNPPRHLGYFVEDSGALVPVPALVSAPDDPGLARAAAAVKHAGRRHLFDCRNGRLLVGFLDGRLAVWYPLCPTRGVDHLPPPPEPLPSLWDVHTNKNTIGAFFLPKDGIHVIISVVFPMPPARKIFSVQACVLQKSGAWGEAILATVEVTSRSRITDMTYVHNKLYMAAEIGYILLLDLVTARLSILNLPEEVDAASLSLSYKEDSGLLLTHVKGFQLNVWHHESDDDGTDIWILVDTICLGAVACDHLEEIFVHKVGDDAEYVLLGSRTRGKATIICVGLRSREEWVCHAKDKRGGYDYLHASRFPFMTVWPPIFPALDED